MRKSPCYAIARGGFMFPVMGFTGKQAAYIAAFNRMEQELTQSGSQSPSFAGLTHRTSWQDFKRRTAAPTH